jgi:EcsC protein family
MQEEDVQALRTAIAALEHPGLAARLAEIAGKPIELFNRALPEPASKAIAVATTQALRTALSVALRTMQNEPKAASSYLHKALAATSGAVGGSFGLAALPIELPISTVIMLRSIGDIARAEGEDLRDPETALSCLQVFALGGLKGEADAANSGYFAVRGLLAKSVAEAARFIVDRGVLAEGGQNAGAPINADRIPFRCCCDAEVCGASRTNCRRSRRCGGELCLHRPFSGDCARAFHRAQTGTALRQRRSARGL